MDIFQLDQRFNPQKDEPSSARYPQDYKPKRRFSFTGINQATRNALAKAMGSALDDEPAAVVQLNDEPTISPSHHDQSRARTAASRPITSFRTEQKEQTTVPSINQQDSEDKEIQAVLAEIALAKTQREQHRTQAFSVDKFLTSNQHLSTEAERLTAAEILKKDLRVRTVNEIESLAKFLQTAEFFTSLSLPICRDMARIAKLKKYKREEIIYREGDDATCFYIIMTGSVGTRIQSQRPDTINQSNSDEGTNSYIAGIEYAGATLGGDSFSSSLLPRHSSTRMAIERTELLVVEMNEYSIIMRSAEREQEKHKMLLLKQLKAMELCTAEELWRLSQVMEPLNCSKNSIIFTQGQRSDRIYFVSTGECRAVFMSEKNERARSASELAGFEEEKPFFLDFGRLGHGTFFGELGLFSNNPTRSATVYAETSCHLFSITYDDFHSRAPKFVLSALKEWGSTLYVQQAQLERMIGQERRWKEWKGKLIQEVKPERNKEPTKWKGRKGFTFK